MGFLSDNSKAHHWSVFFDQIEIYLPTRTWNNVDGLGARRRCYRNRESRGYYWDEEVVHTIPGRLKRIYTFNVSNDTWPRSWFTEGAETYTDNIYTTIDENQTKFTFATVSLSTTNAISQASYSSDKHIDLLTEIFMLNMENIKAMAEAEFKSVTYERPHPYSETYFTGDLDSAVPPITSVTPGKLSRADHLNNLERYPVRLKVKVRLLTGFNLADDRLKRAVEFFLFSADVSVTVTTSSTVGRNRIKPAGIVVITVANHIIVRPDILVQETQGRLLKALIQTLVALLDRYLLA